MPGNTDRLFGTYRCPVCGHRDGAEVPREDPRGQIVCSYCDTPLEVTARSPYDMRFTAQIAEEPATR
ncbi:MAG TPA: primase-helicase zinc-binding domain-containing protein [Longimicrobiales bacterium]|nr:primase-helicase zinc-binding domain-containing protein [Longimicrobiales bacterium]